MHSSISYRAIVPSLTLSLLVAACVPSAPASSIDQNVLDPAVLNNLKVQAEQADPREQCFLYVQVVYRMTEMAGHQMEQGDSERAAATLAEVTEYADQVHARLGDNTKKLKDSEKLMHRATHRLSDFVQHASAEDRPLLENTLKHLNKVQSELLTAVFKH